jgi:16S rRNA (guanine527-N7)-methyltransferase
MTEEEAKTWLNTQLHVSRETMNKLERYVRLLLAEMDVQNLIAESTRGHVWARHIVDSA